MDKIEKLSASEKIQNAMVECLKEKIKLDDLTVAELSKRAGVGKSTFYRHYKDIYDVYEQLIDGFMERCESLIMKIFFEKSLTVKEAVWIFMKSGAKRDNELFYARDAILINHSIENENAKVIDMLYDKAYDIVVKISKRVGADDEASHFGATFFLNGNIVPIMSNLHINGKLNLKTVLITFDLFEMEVEAWKNQKQINF